MKKVILLFFILSHLYVFPQETFIYTTEGKTPLAYELSKIILHAQDTSSESIQKIYSNQILKKVAQQYDCKTFKDNPWMVIDVKPGEITSYSNLKSLLSELNNDSLVMKAYPFMRTSDGILLGITNKFIFKLKEQDDISKYKELFNSLGVIITDRNKLIKQVYYAKVHGNPINVVNKLNELGLFDYVELDYMMKMEMHQPNDQYYNLQWAINRLQVDDAWNVKRGESIKVAVIDDGVDIGHPDLMGNLYNNGFDATGNRDDASPRSYDYHGTMVSGIITAVANNTIGVAGIAYNAKLIPIRGGYGNWISEWYTFPSWLSLAITYAVMQEADIINLSWSVPKITHNIDDFINMAATNGRYGKGCLIFASSGNEYENNVKYPAKLSRVIAVGSSTFGDLKSDFSNYGSELSLVAPGEIIATTDISGGNGKCPGYSYCLGDNYYRGFQGTSASSPVAAAVMALILSVNPNLTREQATNIIESTCDKIGTYNYQPAPNGTKSLETGYGRVNACRAVNAALQTILSVNGNSILCINQTSMYSVPNLPQGFTITWSYSSNLQSVYGGSNYITLRAIGNGNGWVIATLNTNCGQITLPQKAVWVGKPGIPITNPTGYPTYQMSLGQITTIHVTSAPGASSSQYNWEITGSIDRISPNPYSFCTVEAARLGTGNFRVTSQNTCGTSPTGGGTVYVSSGGGGGPLSITPNPANTEIEITINDESTVNETLDKSSSFDNIDYDIKIFNNYGILVYSDKMYGKIDKINISGWQKGLYHISIINRDQIINGTFIVE